MDNTLYVGLSHQMAMRRHMDVVANNLANMNTTAFKKESVVFREYLQDGGTVDAGTPEEIAFVYDLGVARNFDPGDFVNTGNNLDIAVSGRAFMVVAGNDGSDQYTRNGHLHVDEEGRLVTSSGNALLDVDGKEIPIGADDRDINIAADGTVSSSQGRIAQIQLVEFAPGDEQELQKIGESLFTAEVEPQPAAQSKILQGMIEGSNVVPIKEMTTMMEILRSYQSTGRMLEQYQKLQTTAINKLSQVS